MKHLFILYAQRSELSVHDLNSLGRFSPPFLLLLLVLLLSLPPVLLTIKESVLNLITIPQWRLHSWMPEKPKWNIQLDTLLFFSLLNNAFLMHSEQMRSHIPSTKLSILLPRRRTGAQASLQLINLLSRQQQLQEKQQGKTCGSEAVSFHKGRGLEFPSGCELQGSVYLL